MVVIKPALGSVVWYCTLLFLLCISMIIISGCDIRMLTEEEQ